MSNDKPEDKPQKVEVINYDGGGCSAGVACAFLLLIFLTLWTISDNVKKILDKLPEPSTKQETKP